ncbi:MAG: AgmX/PglI C-terminal domain-containing protein [Halobacteriovoraceae bacterium]|nr:AgmX/PglI C-terminal domain-containing protein [Halobacteriovoraceae bacterium]
MIITAENGRFVKALTGAEEGKFGFHKIFGFISEQGALSRLKSRRRRGMLHGKSDWLFRFSITGGKKGNNWKMDALKNCQVDYLKKDHWVVSSRLGKFFFSHAKAANIPTLDIIEKDLDGDSVKAGLTAVALVLFFILSSLLIPTAQEEKPEEEEPVVVEIANQPAVAIKMLPREKPTKEQIKKWKVHRAVQQNLGLLGLVGNKNLTKAVGGLAKLKNASPGAGMGGNQGSGGELLVGLGKGVRKTTVGNTGVKGLGGIGTKGRGGGQGGYGNTSIASGEGAGISTIAVSQDAILDGGLDKYVLAATIQKYLNQVRACYENELQKNPGLAGTVHIDFEVGGKGMLNYSRVKKSTLGNSKAERCITKKMMTWQFPRPKGGVNVPANYPFVLRPSGS